MTKTLVSFLSLLLFLFVHGIASSQIDVSIITARAGFIRTLQTNEPAYSGHIWAFYPEIQVGGRLFKPWLNWGLSWGYWTDGIDCAVPIADNLTFAQTGHIIVLRAGFEPQEADSHWPLPLNIFGGIAEHFQSNTYVGGTGLSGNRGINSSLRVTTLYGGLTVMIPLYQMLHFEAEVAQFIPLGSGDANAGQINRRDFKIGVAMEI